ncbi:hypothetical protein [uncultured Cohaesibacter sp.]|uniref:hypothetical protein n=1 Tax=uncultured Cohaesibacter sp. TaxID=1002546 RepID=UPI0029C65045|nr:hypothetical protein [uncultured Cohaesibacter sp.]
MIRAGDDIYGIHGLESGFERDAMMRNIPRKGFDPLSQFLIATLTTTLVNALPGAVASIGVGGLTAVSQALVAGAALGGAAYASSAFADTRGPSVNPAAAQTTYETEDGPFNIVLGRGRVNGVYGLRTSTGLDTFRLLYQSKAWGNGIDGIEEIYVNDRVVAFDNRGVVLSPPYSWGDGANYMRFYFKDGQESQTAFDVLRDAFPDDWTADHRGRGLSAIVTKYTSPGMASGRYIRVWPQRYPEIGSLIRGPGIFDPRDIGQSFADKSSWKWTDNGLLNVLAVMTLPKQYGGWGMDINEFDLDDIKLEADKADTPVSSLSGSEVLSKCSGVFQTNIANGNTLSDLLLSTGVQPVRLTNGKRSLRLVVDNPNPTISLFQRDVIDFVWPQGELIDDTNKLELWFLSPERNWKMAQLDIDDKSWASDAQSINRTDERITKLELQFCPQPRQAQVIARRHFRNLRAPKVSLVTQEIGGCAMGRSAASLVGMSDLTGEDGDQTVLIGPVTEDFANGSVSVPVTLIDELDDWSPAEHEVPAPVALADVQFSGSIGIPSILGAVKIVNISGGKELRFRWSDVEDAYGYEADIRLVTADIPGNYERLTEDVSHRFAYGGDVEIGERYYCMVRAFSSDYEAGDFSDIKDVTLAYDTAAPTGCTISLDLTSDPSPVYPDSERIYTLTAQSSDMNISRIDVGEGFVYVRPYEVVTRTITVTTTDPGGSTTWNPPPTGVVKFSNSTGQLTEISY